MATATSVRGRIIGFFQVDGLEYLLLVHRSGLPCLLNLRQRGVRLLAVSLLGCLGEDLSLWSWFVQLGGTTCSWGRAERGQLFSREELELYCLQRPPPSHWSGI